MNKLQAVFLDRDGTIGGTGAFCHPRDFVMFPFAPAAIARLKAAGVRLFAFTNQPRVGRREATESEFRAQFAQFGFDGTYICPHLPDDGCPCRKPSPYLLQQAAREHGLDLSRCAVVGDWGSMDMLAARAAGAIAVLVRTGYGESSLGEFRHTWSEVEPDFVAADLTAAVGWLLGGGGKQA